MASQDVLKKLLRDACLRWHEERAEPAIEICFRSPSRKERSRREVVTQHWVAIELNTQHVDEIGECAWQIVRELMTVPVNLLYEILAGRNRLLPILPKALDGAPLHSPNDGRGRHRFGVVGGNTMTTTGDVIKDVRLAVARLAAINIKKPLKYSDRLRILCHPTLVDWFGLVHGVVPFLIDVIEFEHLSNEDPWFLCRQPVAVIKVGSPTLLVEMKEGTIGVGAKFAVWLDDPTGSVRVDPRLEED